MRNFRQIERIFDNHTFDFVYHLAAEYGRWNGEDYYENLWQTNVIGTKHMLRLQEKQKFRMIFFSSVVGWSRVRLPLLKLVIHRSPDAFDHVSPFEGSGR